MGDRGWTAKIADLESRGAIDPQRTGLALDQLLFAACIFFLWSASGLSWWLLGVLMAVRIAAYLLFVRTWLRMDVDAGRGSR